MLNASEMLYSNGNNLFQTAMFCTAGFCASLMLMAVGAYPVLYPWF